MSNLEKYVHLKVSCPNEELGCPWKGLLKDVDEHSVPCDKKLFRSALIEIHMIKGRLEQKDREITFLKNDFALKIQNIAKKSVIKKKEKLKKINDQTEKIGELVLAQLEEVKQENVKKNEEVENLKKEVEELKQAKSEENRNLRFQLEQLKKENRKINKEIREVRDELRKVSSNIKEEKEVPPAGPITRPTEIVTQNTTIVPSTKKVFFDLAVSGNTIGRIVIDLSLLKAPKTCTKFLQLCSHEKGVGYIGSKVYTINNDCIYIGLSSTLTYPTGSSKQFPTEYRTPLENLSEKHDGKGIVSMSTSDGTTLSCFLITRKPCTTLDGNYVIIGKITEESWSIMKEIVKQPTSCQNGPPKQTISVTDCGVLTS